MTIPVLAPPPPDIHRRESESLPQGTRGKPVISSPRASLPRITSASLWLSLALHAVVLLLFVTFLRLGPRLEVSETEAPEEQVEYFDLAFPAPVASAEAPSPEPPLPVLPSAQAPATAGVASPAQGERDEDESIVFPRSTGAEAPTPAPSEPGAVNVPQGSATATGASAADRLNPGYTDSRLYVDAGAITQPDSKQSDIERYKAHLRARIDAVNDSSYAAGSHPNTDWTVTDKNGGKWGLAPDGLHLGKLTIPSFLLPKPSATGSNEKLEKAREEARQAAEIQRQENARAQKKNEKERIKATREHVDAERQQAADSAS